MNKLVIILAAVACLLGIGAAVGTLVMRWNKLIELKNAPEKEPEVFANDWNFWTLEISLLSEELRKERESIGKKKAELDTLEKRLQAERAELLRVRQQIEDIRDEIQKSVVTLLESEKPNLKSLSRSYSAMKPSEAVEIIQNLNDEMIVKILSLMKPNVVAAILTQLSASSSKDPSLPKGSERAARITEKLRLLKDTEKKETKE